MAEVATETQPPHDEPELGAQVVRGLKWSFAGTSTLRLGTFMTSLIMARLLAPEDFGIYSLGAVILMVTASVNDIGIEPTLVRWRGNIDEVLPTAWCLVTAVSVSMFTAFWVLAPRLATLLHAPHGAGIVRLMSVGLIISGIFTVNSAITTREFRQKVRSSAEITGMVVEIVLSIALAKAGFRAYSLAWAHIASNLIVGMVLFIKTPVRFRPSFQKKAVRMLIHEGAPLAGNGLLSVAVLNADYILVGRFLGPNTLGLYVLAWNVASWPVSLFSEAVTRVSVAGFAKLQNDCQRLNEALSRSLSAVIGVTLPFCVLLGGLALPLVRFFYGHKWEAAAVPLRFLAAAVAIRVGTMVARDALVAAGQGRMALKLQALWLVGLVACLSLGARLWGIEGVGVGHLVVAGAIVLPAYLLTLRHRGFQVAPLARSVVRPLLGALGVAALTMVTGHFGHFGDFPDFVHLALGGTLGLAVYTAVLVPVWKPPLKARLGARRLHRGPAA